MGVAVLEGDVDDYEVVDMVEILPNPLSGDVRVNITNDQVTGGPDTYLVCNVTGKDELPVVPSEFDLALILAFAGNINSFLTYSFSMDVDVVPLSIVHEVLGSGALNERDACSPLVCP